MIEYEQKYKEALEKAKYWHKEGYGKGCQELVEDIFPELKDSEDELTWLTKYIEEEAYGLSMDIRDNEDRIKLKKLQKALTWLEKQKEPELSEDLGKYIAELSKQFPEVSFAKLSRIAVRVKNWFEKQGKQSEQKPSLRERYDRIKNSEWFKKTHEGMSISDDENVDGDMKETEHTIKPKFHEGDWITCEELNTALIVNIDNDRYEVEFIDGNKGFPHIDYIDRLFHLWTIKDAKDGDVLASKDKLSILIFKNLDTSTSFSSYYNIAGQGELGWSNDCFIPATKEQRDLLFQKMHEAGYDGYDWYNHALMKV